MSSARSNYSPCSAVNTRCCQFEDAALKEARNSVWLVLFFYFDSWLQSPAEVQVLEELYHHDGFCIRVPLVLGYQILSLDVIKKRGFQQAYCKTMW